MFTTATKTKRSSFKRFALASFALLAAGTMQMQKASATPYAHGHTNAAAINRIIHQLSPVGWSHGGHSYYGHHNHHAYHPSYGSYTRDYYVPYIAHQVHTVPYYGHTSYEAASYYDLDDSIYTRSMDFAVFFSPGSSHITPRGAQVLDNLGYALSSTSFAHSVYRIAGHTDAVGTDYDNRLLSKRRAHAVKKYLVHKFHIDPRRLIAVGFGEDRLKAPYNPTSSINRRVEVTLIASSYRDLPYTRSQNE